MFTTIPAEFSELTRQALKHLYDLAQLQRIGATMRRLTGAASPLTARQLQVEVVKTVDQLRPATRMDYLASDARLSNLVHGHYIEGFSIDHVARENAVSVRQAHRDLRRAEEAVTRILWETLAGAAATHVAAQAAGASVDEEVAALVNRREPFDVTSVIQSAYDAVEPLAVMQGVSLLLEFADGKVRTSGNQTVAQQFFVSLLSHVVQHARPQNPITVSLKRRPAEVCVQIDFQSNALDLTETRPPQVADKLARFLGWRIDASAPGSIEVVATASSRRVLVVDDNEGLIDLMGHYLREHGYEVFGCMNSQDAVATAQSLQPNFIFLDVMMPGLDGWQVLKGLRESELTRALPVVICSVFEDRVLAQSLAARHYLVKPVTRQSVADVLAEMNRGGEELWQQSGVTER